MEVKIACNCGQNYQFDVEPVNGRMPVAVGCPNCAADGTAKANEILAKRFPNPSPTPLMSIPVPASPTKLRISRPPPPLDTNDAT